MLTPPNVVISFFVACGPWLAKDVWIDEALRALCNGIPISEYHRCIDGSTAGRLSRPIRPPCEDNGRAVEPVGSCREVDASSFFEDARTAAVSTAAGAFVEDVVEAEEEG